MRKLSPSHFLPYFLCLPFLFPSSLFPSPLNFFSSSFFSPFTDAIVVIEFTKRDIDDHYSVRSWDKGKALVLAVGDVITDVKLVSS